MEEFTTNHQILQQHFEAPEGQKLLRMLQLLTAAMLLGSLMAGLAFALITGPENDEGAPPQATAPSNRPPDQPENAATLAFPMLGVTAGVVALGGLIFGTLVLRQRREGNQAMLHGGDTLSNPAAILQTSMVAWLVAAAMREGPFLLALLFAMVTNGSERTLCLGVALAVFGWWCLHLPTRAKFASTLGLD